MAAIYGNFTEQQLAKFRYIFDLFDLNKDGVIQATELAEVSKLLGYRLPKEQVYSLLMFFDMDEHGALTFEQFLEAMPGNKNLISQDEHEKAELRRKFQEYDTDGNGYISPEEAQVVLSKELGFTPNKTQMLIGQCDTNDDGQLSYEEFVGFYTRVKQKKSVIDQAFKKFDAENKGYVTVDDAKRILSEMDFTDDEIESLVKTHDTNQDGKLQYEEFVRFWSY